MTGPKHLWSGDWEEESRAAAARRRSAPLDVAAAAPPPAAPEAPPQLIRPVEPAPVRRSARRRRRLDRRQLRRVLSVVALALVVLAAAVALGRVGSGSSASSGSAASAYLGLRLGVLPAGTVVVTRVAPHSPAAAAGMHAGDVITQVQGRPVGAPVNVTEAVDALAPGDTVQIQVFRGSHPLSVSVQLAKRPSGAP